MPRDREYELRFTLDEADGERLVSHPLLRRALRDGRTGRLVSTYFDTPDRALQRNRFGLRVRRADNGTIHTLKQTGGSLVDRGEWEQAHEATQPDVGWLSETPLAPLLRRQDVAASLGPRFSVDVTRTSFTLRSKGALIEVALDQGAIGAEGVSLPLREVELEIKQGPPAAVLDLARELVRDVPLVLSLASKAERGYALSDLTWGRPTEAITPVLTEGMTIAQSFEAVLQACLHAFLKNIALIDGDEDGEALHKARIALRHLRAACQLFAPALRRKRLAALRSEIKWLSDQLGAARDADVFQRAFFDPAARDADVPGGQALASVMGDYRRRAHARLSAALSSFRARLLFVELLAFSSDGIRRPRRREACRPFVRAAIDKRRRKLARQATGLARQPIEAQHEVRKAAKMLRYDIDLFAGLPKLGRAAKGRRLGKSLKTLQQCLGVLNDEEAMRVHLRDKVLSRRFAYTTASAEQRRAVSAAAQLSSRRTSPEALLRQAEAAALQL